MLRTGLCAVSLGFSSDRQLSSDPAGMTRVDVRVSLSRASHFGAWSCFSRASLTRNKRICCCPQPRSFVLWSDMYHQLPVGQLAKVQTSVYGQNYNMTRDRDRSTAGIVAWFLLLTLPWEATLMESPWLSGRSWLRTPTASSVLFLWLVCAHSRAPEIRRVTTHVQE